MKQLENLTKRQKFILELIERFEKISNRDLLEKIVEKFDRTSRITLIRDLNAILQNGFIKKTGRGRSTLYEPKIDPLIRHFDAENYFQEEPDKRIIQAKKINFSKDIHINAIINAKELASVEKLTSLFRQRRSVYSEQKIKKELERITIEFAWKSSRIEGNTYTLLDTERLIKQREEAKGKTHEEAIMILNHKTALEYALSHPKQFKKLSIAKIEEIHELISNRLSIERGLRKRPAGIVGTAYRPYDNIYQIREAMEDLCALLDKTNNSFLKAMLAAAGISYIQPFEDGNKRTSRLLGNAILMADDYCPLSYRSINEGEYKKAVILFYEMHSIEYFKKLFIEQYEFAIKNYFP